MVGIPKERIWRHLTDKQLQAESTIVSNAENVRPRRLAAGHSSMTH